METKINNYIGGGYGRRERGICMCDPNNIVFDAMMDFDEQGQKNIGYVHNNKLYFTVLQSGNCRVSGKASDIVQKANQVKMDSFVDLEDILREAGWKKVTSEMLNAPIKEYKINIDGISSEEAFAKVEMIKDMLDKNPDAELPDYVEVKILPPSEVETKLPNYLDFSNPTKEMLLNLFA